MTEIDPRAIVSPSAKFGSGVKVGACAVVGDDVELGDGCRLEPHAVVQGPSKFGKNNHVHSFAIVGGDPQDLTYTGQRTCLEVGDENEFREFCTVHRGTIKGGGSTRIGSHNLIMAYAHIGHDCVIGNHVILTNGAQLAGHIVVEDYAGISAFCLLHQFSRVGAHSYIGAGTVITQHVVPYSMVVGERGVKCFGINKVGLQRHGFSPERIKAVEQAYRLLLRSRLNTSQAIEQMRGTLADSEDVQLLIRFIESAGERGFTK
jgi:UDP-N-acetylglucosamine acyltransferase